jgi:hypothetical protein
MNDRRHVAAARHVTPRPWPRPNGRKPGDPLFDADQGESAKIVLELDHMESGCGGVTMALYLVVMLMAIATAVVFFEGLRSMVRGGAYDRHSSGAFMLMRVEFQALALGLMALAILLAKY